MQQTISSQVNLYKHIEYESIMFIPLATGLLLSVAKASGLMWSSSNMVSCLFVLENELIYMHGLSYAHTSIYIIVHTLEAWRSRTSINVS